MNETYRVITARAADIAFLGEIERAAAALFPDADLSPALRSEVTPLEELQAAQRDGRLWVAVTTDDTPIGFAIVEIIDGRPHLEEIDVHPRHGRRGVGTLLLRAVCDWARASGASAVTLTTFSHLPWNAPFYARFGFRVLAPDEIAPGLAAVVRDETQRGLDPAKRVAMRCDLDR